MEYQSYYAIARRVKFVAAGLLSLISQGGGVNSGRVGLLAITCAECVIVSEVCHAHSVPLVALHENFDVKTIGALVEGLPLIVCSHSRLHRLLDALRLNAGAKQQQDQVRVIVQIDLDVSAEDVALAATRGTRLVSWAQVEAAGMNGAAAATLGDSTAKTKGKPSPDDVALVTFSSGSTGAPKAISLTHRNLVAALAGCWVSIWKQENKGEDDVHVSYLPFGFVFERIIQGSCMYTGGKVAFFSGSLDGLLDDFRVLRPTIMVSVPRLFAMVYARVMTDLESSNRVTKSAWDTAYASKKEALKQGYYTNMLYDNTVFSSVRSIFGGRVRTIVIGGAPIHPTLLEFLRIAVAPVYQGYGMTECGGCVCVSQIDYATSTSVGGPIACNEIRLVSAPDLGYLVSDSPHPRGEILVRGPNVAPSAAGEGGWFRTGDIGTIRENQLYIIDRRSNIVKIANGEFISMENTEAVYSLSPLVSQVYCFVRGGFLIGVVVIDAAAVENYCKVLSADFGDLDLSITPERGLSQGLRDLLVTKLQELAAKEDLPETQRISTFHFETEKWTPANSLLTPSFKLNRRALYQRFEGVADDKLGPLSPRGL